MERPAKKVKLEKLKQKTTEKQLFVDSGFYDDEITIYTEDGNQLFASKGFLVYSSPVFEKMFSSDFKEKREKKIEVKGKYNDCLNFLRNLQARENHVGITDENIFEITKMANYYQTECLLYQCCSKLKEMILACKTTNASWDELLDILAFADSHDLSDVVDTWINVACRFGSKNYRDSKKFEKVHVDIKLRVFKKRLERKDDDYDDDDDDY